MFVLESTTIIGCSNREKAHSEDKLPIEKKTSLEKDKGIGIFLLHLSKTEIS